MERKRKWSLETFLVVRKTYFHYGKFKPMGVCMYSQSRLKRFASKYLRGVWEFLTCRNRKCVRN
jgi:hypothetical protein